MFNSQNKKNLHNSVSVKQTTWFKIMDRGTE